MPKRRFNLSFFVGAPCLVATACLAATVSCAPDSYLVLTLISSDGPFTQVGWVEVKVLDASKIKMATLTYDRSKNPFDFGDSTLPKTLSLSFTPSQSGVVTLDVRVFTADRVCIGKGANSVTIKKGDVSPVVVTLRHDGACGGSDGGVVADGGVTFPGCDPAAPADMCPGNQTCFVDCVSKKGMCVAGGTKGPGETCTTNNDCVSGTQCFDYGNVSGCAPGTKVCLKFCSADNQCLGTVTGSGGSPGAAGSSGAAGNGGAAGSGGAGGASGTGGNTTPAAFTGPGACKNPVVCASNVTSYRTCSFGCDPRGDATAGCPAGLLCFLYRDPAGGQDSPDCGCREPSRTGTDGMPCTTSASCAPGHICNVMNGTQTCRKLCKMSALTDCSAPRTCNALLNNSVFGVCVGG
ncbi:MAG: hypothetical protein ABUL77_02790 [Bacteroidota bacterium]